jgi:lysyl-tRNA synthetase class 2
MKTDVLTIAKRRSYLKQITRDFFQSRGYLEVDTPIVTRCPGTEIHLQYFATSWEDHRGTLHNRWLRSSPEIHMKRVIAEGVEKAFQIAPCFRNRGEYSPWHHPEFTMLEWYSLGLGYHDLIRETEDYLRTTAEAFSIVSGLPVSDCLPKQFRWIGVFEAFRDFAGIDLIDGDPELAAKAVEASVISVQKTDDFETAYFKVLIEVVEPRLASLGACVLMDYPPSQAALSVVEGGKAARFEVYVGRVELCNGFFELIGEQENRKRVGEAMALRAAHGYPMVEEDQDFYRAMAKFKKPCSGNALGFDRWMALLSGSQSLDSAILFRDI